MTDERDAFDARPDGRRDARARRAEADAAARGRLRVYLGMAPGVGKTYRMLEEGHRRVDRGTDLVVGFVEPHGRPHTIELARRARGRAAAAGRVPRRRRRGDGHRRGHRAPADRRARRRAGPHERARARAREKRWQDVEVIRDAGIHVVTHAERPAPRVRRRRGRDDHRRAGQRAPARRGAARPPTRSSSST